MSKPIIILSPVVIVAAGFVCAHGFSQLIREWAFIPLALVYWSLALAAAYKALGKGAIMKLFVKPERNILWMLLCFAVALIPLPILLLNINLFTSPAVIALWLAFSFINPFVEEIYWRGFLLNALPFPKNLATAYSTVLFTVSHPAMWGAFSIANRSWMTCASLLLMGTVWSFAYRKAGSLWWCVISHFFVDILNLSVFVFLNLYVPPIL